MAAGVSHLRFLFLKTILASYNFNGWAQDTGDALNAI
jgi:hypothetical protein